MTAQEIITQVYEDVGEPTDLCPYTDPADTATFDITTAGAVRLLRAVNQAIIRIANWQFRDGHVMRFRNLFDRKYFTVGKTYAATTRLGAARNVMIDVTVDLPLGTDLDGWIVEVTSGLSIGERFLVIRTEDVTDGDGDHLRLTIAGAWTTVPLITDTVEVSRNFARFLSIADFNTDEDEDINIDPVVQLADIMRIRDIENGVDLEKTYYNDTFTGSVDQSGTPSQYAVAGDKLFLDVFPDEQISMEILYARHPAELTAATDEPELPEPFHEAIALWAIRAMQRRQQAFEKAYATKREVEDLMNQLRQQGHFENEYEVSGLVVYG